MLTLLSLLATAHAQHDYAQEAVQRMALEFDLDDVQAELASPRAEAPEVARLPLEPNSTLRGVTVFQDHALVTRERRLRAAAGLQTVVFEGLPHTIRAEGLAGIVLDGQARVVGVELGSTTATVDEDARFEKLRTEALELTRQLGEVRDRLESLLGQRAYLRFTLLAQRGEGAPQPDLGVVRTTFTYVGEAEAALAKELREQEDRARELSEALQPLLVKMRNPTATGRTVRVDVEVQQEATIGLRYHVDGAGWSPAYNARLVGDDRIELAYFGVVRQHTGEDWTDASVSLSTADTQGSSVLPELEPWYLGRDDGLSLDTGVIVAPLASDAGPTGGGLIASNLTATVEGTGAVVFSLPDRRTVPGDGASQRLPLGTQTFAAALDYTTVPKLVQEVHRRASLRYDGAVPLLPGQLSTFAGADYLGSGAITAAVPGEVLRLAFGADERLKVRRQLVSRRREVLGAGKRTTRFHFHFRITVDNYADTARTVELRDQLPVSELDKVTVKEVRLTEGAVQDLRSPGALTWSLVIPPGGQRTVDLEFEITAPTDIAQQTLRAMEMLF